jgi:predicted Zn finger-like uncharacterized protein
MDVTCERCGTAYEFDDALVSERGTTVKCTNCGHQFKVRRPQQGAGTPERWIVRTIDGRELEFRALRELQAAIAQALISRDDVLSRGGSRPRRLGNIAELEPFFAAAAGSVHSTTLGLGPKNPPRVRTPTPGGLPPAGAAPGRGEVSIAIPLPKGEGQHEEPDDNNETRVMEGPPPAVRRVPSVPPPKPPPPPKRSTPPPPPNSPPGMIVSPRGAPPPPGAPIYDQLTVGPGAYGDVTRAIGGASDAHVHGPAPAPPPPGAPIYDQLTVGPASHADATRVAHDQVRAAAAGMRRAEGDDVSGPTAPFAISQALDPVKVRALIQDDWAPAVPPAPRAPQLLPESDPSYDGGATQDPEPPPPPRVRAAPPRPPSPAPAPSQDGPSANPLAATEIDAAAPPLPDHGALDAAFAAASGSAVSTQTPTPAGVRAGYGDDTYGEHQAPAAPSPRRAGAARWIGGLVVAGMAALALATVGKRFLDTTPPPPKGAVADARIATLLTEGEKLFTDGDLESAKERFDKASVLAERDARAAADLARVAAARADVEWLRVRLYPEGDPERVAAERELALAAPRAKAAADQAAAIAPNDPAVIRSRIDALRLAGDVDGARRIVGPIAAASTQPDNALALAELDLAESRPDWTTVVTRLRAAVESDGNLGRARAMLVYALVRSRNYEGAEAELGRLAELPRPHPLAGALRAYIARTEKADANALPDASGKASAGRASSPPGGAPASPSPSPREPREPREHDHPPPEPKAPPPDMPAPTPPAGPIDTSDLPGVKAPPAPDKPAPDKPAPAPAPTPTSNTPSGVDTSDLPGFK